jgi:hypothetical protein
LFVQVSHHLSKSLVYDPHERDMILMRHEIIVRFVAGEGGVKNLFPVALSFGNLYNSLHLRGKI